MRVIPENSIKFRSTLPVDLDYVLEAEQHSENRPFVAQWTREQHLQCMGNADDRHFIVLSGEYRVGYAILTIKNRVVELKRLVITEKGQGFGRAVLKAVKRMAFEESNAHRLWLDVRSNNTRALRLYQSEGFVMEGTLRDTAFYEGEFLSVTVLSILEDEYRAALAGNNQALLTKAYETDRLQLRMLAEEHADVVLEYYRRNAHFLDEWEPGRSDNFYTREYHAEVLKNERINMEAGRLVRLWLFKKGEPSRVIGNIGFNNIVRGAFLSCHLGYKLDGEEINKGYITEALRKGIEVMFSEYGLHRIEANIIPRNARSRRVVEKLGFYNEGLAYKYLKINGRWEDHIHMVLLNDNV